MTSIKRLVILEAQDLTMPDIPKWNEKEFRTFLLIHASHADLEFTDDERQAIVDIVSTETFEEIYGQYEEMGEYEIIKTIIDYKGLYFPTLDRKEELLSIIQKQFSADGHVSKLEKSLILFLNKLL